MPSTLHFALLAASIISTTNAQSDPYAYIDSVCSPSNATGYPDLEFPCNAVQAIQAQCIYGTTGLDIIMGDENPSPSSSAQKRQSSPDDSLPKAQSNATQQVCFCKSEFWSLTAACASCYSAHGDHELEKSAGKSAVESLSEKYCAASATPSLGLADYLFQFAGDFEASSSPKTSKFKDSIGNKTEISYYYTASVTGSQAWVVADPTATSGVVKDGQLVATASANSDAAKEGAAGRRTGVVAAVLGLAGLVTLFMI